MLPVLLFTIAVFFITPTGAWDSDDIEIYDLVEEINQNFYSVLGVHQDASVPDIRRAYRRLSLVLHPDKNKEDGAADRFRKMAAVYEVLKDSNKRQKYNQVLEHGLPDWRQPVYYYRRARRISLTELFVLLFVITAVGQYIVLWAMCFEKRLSLEDFFSSKRRRSTRKKKDGYDPDEELQAELDALPRPKFTDLFPCRLTCLLCRLVILSPVYFSSLKQYIREQREIQQKAKEDNSEDEEIEYVRKPKRRQRIELPEYSGDDYTSPVSCLQLGNDEQDTEVRYLKTGNWTDDELGLLAKGVAKYPGGTPSRWSKVAEFVGRSMEEVIEKSRQLRSGKTVNISCAAQGTTGVESHPVSFKNGPTISDDIISTNDVDYRGDDESGSNGDSIPTLDARSLQHGEGDRRGSAHDVDAKTSRIPVVRTKSRMKPVAEKSSSSSETNKKQVKRNESNAENQTDVNDASRLPSDNWTQNQQVILEWAMKQYPKSCDDRWDNIAAHIPGKSKEECMQRFKRLAEMLKQRRQQKADVVS